MAITTMKNTDHHWHEYILSHPLFTSRIKCSTLKMLNQHGGYNHNQNYSVISCIIRELRRIHQNSKDNLNY